MKGIRGKGCKGCIFTLLLNPALADTEVSYVVSGIDDPQGSVVLAVYDQANAKHFPADPSKAECVVSAPASTSLSSVLVLHCPELKPGNYSAVAFLDQNNNGKLDHTWYFRPKEKLGLSNGCKPAFPPPKFQQCMFVVTDIEPKQVKIELARM